MNYKPITIDLSYLYSLAGGDKSFEQILLIGVVEDVNIKVSGLKDSWYVRDAEGIRKNAHSLISLSAIAGMPEVEGWSRTIDQVFADGEFHPELEILAQSIIAGWPAAKSALNRVIEAN